jgi:hypothetical protein
MRDVIFEPGATVPSNEMMNAMVCHITQGELKIVQNGKEFVAKKDHVWTCAKGTTTRGDERGHDSGDHADYRFARDLTPSTCEGTWPDNRAFCEAGHLHDPALARRRKEVGRTVAHCASLASPSPLLCEFARNKETPPVQGYLKPL